MVTIVWASVLWILVFILLPLERIKILWPVAVVSFIWMFALNYTFIQLGYYQFTKYILVVGGVPVLVPIGGAAGGILLINWIQRSAWFKIVLVLVFSGILNLATTVFMWFDAFKMLHGFNHFLHFVVNVAGISILVWLSLALVDNEKIYNDKDKTRFIR